ncbi:hypothetical protein IE53DRAFT_368117 [Violaceomyces palustris]|uniref:Uncharacterized protein n=1 Tax=Violaceomyces palustris TaxID=1673888 RepID=A0ACD0P049_9BASI|nr:hypothetical protein IE53DRAFT_368117 [Violaceomyces palustris]
MQPYPSSEKQSDGFHDLHTLIGSDRLNVDNLKVEAFPRSSFRISISSGEDARRISRFSYEKRSRRSIAAFFCCAGRHSASIYDDEGTEKAATKELAPRSIAGDQAAEQVVQGIHYQKASECSSRYGSSDSALLSVKLPPYQRVRGGKGASHWNSSEAELRSAVAESLNEKMPQGQISEQEHLASRSDALVPSSVIQPPTASSVGSLSSFSSYPSGNSLASRPRNLIFASNRSSESDPVCRDYPLAGFYDARSPMRPSPSLINSTGPVKRASDPLESTPAKGLEELGESCTSKGSHVLETSRPSASTLAEMRKHRRNGMSNLSIASIAMLSHVANSTESLVEAQFSSDETAVSSREGPQSTISTLSPAEEAAIDPTPVMECRKILPDATMSDSRRTLYSWESRMTQKGSWQANDQLRPDYGGSSSSLSSNCTKKHSLDDYWLNHAQPKASRSTQSLNAGLPSASPEQYPRLISPFTETQDQKRPKDISSAISLSKAADGSADPSENAVQLTSTSSSAELDDTTESDEMKLRNESSSQRRFSDLSQNLDSLVIEACKLAASFPNPMTLSKTGDSCQGVTGKRLRSQQQMARATFGHSQNALESKIHVGNPIHASIKDSSEWQHPNSDDTLSNTYGFPLRNSSRIISTECHQATDFCASTRPESHYQADQTRRERRSSSGSNTSSAPPAFPPPDCPLPPIPGNSHNFKRTTFGQYAEPIQFDGSASLKRGPSGMTRLSSMRRSASSAKTNSFRPRTPKKHLRDNSEASQLHRPPSSKGQSRRTTQYHGSRGGSFSSVTMYDGRSCFSPIPSSDAGSEDFTASSYSCSSTKSPICTAADVFGSTLSEDYALELGKIGSLKPRRNPELKSHFSPSTSPVVGMSMIAECFDKEGLDLTGEVKSAPLEREDLMMNRRRQQSNIRTGSDRLASLEILSNSLVEIGSAY